MKEEERNSYGEKEEMIEEREESFILLIMSLLFNLLGWMHRKFRQNSSEPLKDFSGPVFLPCILLRPSRIKVTFVNVSGNPCTCLTGQPSLDDLQGYPKLNYYYKSLSKAQRDNHLRKSFAGLEAAARADHDDLEDESSAALSELFHGFLAIGTLGTDTLIDDPSTPTFSISVENIAEKDTEVTENELKLINDELEKVLGAEANKDDGCNLSSGRNSYVSTGRSSHGMSKCVITSSKNLKLYLLCIYLIIYSTGSTITLSGKQLESTENSGNGTTVCPLQGYLFGSTVGLPETTPASSAKKERRPSLGELFQKTKLAEENYGAKSEKRTDKDSDKSAVHLMKKILKKKMLHASSRNSVASGGTVDSVSAESKPHKILQLFHRKVHPESSVPAQKPDMSSKNERAHDRGGLSLSRDDITIIPHHRLSKDSIKVLKGQSNMQHFTLDGDSNENRECWIKTDADYPKQRDEKEDHHQWKLDQGEEPQKHVGILSLRIRE
ncbi:hypothetical protein RND71_003350 [Anisodus tanguticus]|uniref:Uncharacterized protein n=1 Tax=Anisodus tanguticus TaxID=243964 RepID=A0AAE1SUF1_9SOLA|nr:hypothetical protein RND71_003350 [Anisodus tanguticus]